MSVLITALAGVGGVALGGLLVVLFLSWQMWRADLRWPKDMRRPMRAYVTMWLPRHALFSWRDRNSQCKTFASKPAQISMTSKPWVERSR